MGFSGLRDKVALVTGASRGIGRAVALRLAQEGARLVLGFRENEVAAKEAEAACAAAGAPVALLAGDVADPRTAQALVDLALARHGRVDVLVNNAGVSRDELLAAAKDDDVTAMVSTNVLGAVWASRAVMAPMLRQRSGVILNVSSVVAQHPGRGNAVYAGTKGFLESFTRALAVEVGRKGIRVAAVAPGIIATDMTAPLRQQAGEELRARVGLRRLGEPDEVAALIAFLASDESRYLSGAVFAVDGAFV